MAVEWVWAGDVPNGPEGKVGLGQDHYRVGQVPGMELGCPLLWSVTLSVRMISQLFPSQGTEAEWAGGWVPRPNPIPSAP